MKNIIVCIVVSAITSVIVNKIMATYYFKVIDDHINKTMKMLLDFFKDKQI